MAYIDLVILIVSLGFGAWLGVWQHDNFLKWWQGAQTFATNLETKAAAIKAAATTAPAK
jgi:hypothetical protein